MFGVGVSSEVGFIFAPAGCYLQLQAARAALSLALCAVCVKHDSASAWSILYSISIRLIPFLNLHEGRWYEQSQIRVRLYFGA